MVGVREIDRSLEQWQMGVKDLRRRVLLAPTPRERERWYALLLLAQGWSIGDGGSLGTGPSHHWTLGGGLRRGRAQSLDIRADRWFPPALGEAQREELRAAVQKLPAEAGMDLANWTGKGSISLSGNGSASA